MDESQRLVASSTNRTFRQTPENTPSTDRNEKISPANLDEVKHNPDGRSSQQFCLRWNNHTTSLLSTLPQLLDQSHLSDCTIFADGKKIRAHRLVLSGCSTFFSELFHTLETGIQPHSCHPVVVLPANTNFTSLVALFTFMYSGEVNVYEDQISNLLELAETLGIKGLNEINKGMSAVKSNTEHAERQYSFEATPTADDSEKPTILTTQTSQNTPNSTYELFEFSPKNLSPPPSFDAFFSRPNQSQYSFYPHHIAQPLNFSTSQHPFASMVPKTQPQLPCSLPFNKISNIIDEDNMNYNEHYKKDRMKHEKRLKTAHLRKIDTIAEKLRLGADLVSSPSLVSPNSANSFLDNFNQMSMVKNESSPTSFSISSVKASTLEGVLNYNIGTQKKSPLTINSGPPTKIPNSKLFAKCFICSKLLSNQYNLRVHLETHQNMRYACTVCTHVSRSKDALRKHISYRHPGTPSPSENENKRKRTKLASQIQQIQAQQIFKDQMSAGRILFTLNPTSQEGVSHYPLNMEPNSNQLSLLQSFTTEMTTSPPTLFSHHKKHQSLPVVPTQSIKTEINNNGEEAIEEASHNLL